MERKLSWSSGVFEEIGLVYDKAERSGASHLLSSLEDRALAEARSNSRMISENGRPVSPSEFDALPDDPKEQLIAHLAGVGLEEFCTDIDNPTITVRLSPIISPILNCTAFSLLNQIEKLDGTINMLHPKVTLGIQAPVGTPKDLALIGQMIAILYPWLTVRIASSNVKPVMERQSQSKTEPTSTPSKRKNENKTTGQKSETRPKPFVRSLYNRLGQKGNPTTTQPKVSQIPAPPTQSTKFTKEKRSPLQSLLLACLSIILILAVAVVGFLQYFKQETYSQAQQLLQQEEYSQAYELLEVLGDYRDSATQREYCQQEITYLEACKTMERREYSLAKALFDAIPDLRDANLLSTQCSQAMRYEQGLELYNQGEYAQAKAQLDTILDFEDAKYYSDQCGKVLNYEQGLELYSQKEYSAAREAFEKAGDYLDAVEYALRCNQWEDYFCALELMDVGDYEAALALLESLDGELIPDLGRDFETCRNVVTFSKAQQLLASGENYDAYKLLQSIPDYPGALDLAKRCIVYKPSTGEIYRNPAYPLNGVRLTIAPPEDGSCNYIKVYTPDGDLISCIFINANQRIIVSLPTGELCLSVAYGYGDWFGEKGMFGDEGVYQRIRPNYFDDSFLFESGYRYTLSLRVNGNGNGGPNRDVSRTDF